jgi:hypothetical protein
MWMLSDATGETDADHVELTAGLCVRPDGARIPRSAQPLAVSSLRADRSPNGRESPQRIPVSFHTGVETATYTAINALRNFTIGSAAARIKEVDDLGVNHAEDGWHHSGSTALCTADPCTCSPMHIAHAREGTRACTHACTHTCSGCSRLCACMHAPEMKFLQYLAGSGRSASLAFFTMCTIDGWIALPKTPSTFFESRTASGSLRTRRQTGKHPRGGLSLLRLGQCGFRA